MTNADLSAWIGRTETIRDTVVPAVVERLWATLDRDDPSPSVGDPLPPLAHWLYFLSAARQSAIDMDGHEARGHFLPPVTLPRRMWAGSTLTFHRALPIGAQAERVSTITAVVSKKGRSGPLVFVTVRHEIGYSSGAAITELQDIVYRSPAAPGEAPGAPQRCSEPAEWTRTVRPDAVMLFRYSALTFNGHRIHYDRSYATNHEGYAGLIVHGPLIATLLFDLLGRSDPAFIPSSAEIRAISPLFDGNDIILSGRRTGDSIALWATDIDGRLAMRIDAYGR